MSFTENCTLLFSGFLAKVHIFIFNLTNTWKTKRRPISSDAGKRRRCGHSVPFSAPSVPGSDQLTVPVRLSLLCSPTSLHRPAHAPDGTGERSAYSVGETAPLPPVTHNGGGLTPWSPQSDDGPEQSD